MNKQEMTQALEIAKDQSQNLTDVDTDVMFGYGLPDFKPVHVTTRQVASIIRWQAGRFDGTWDAKEIDDIANLGRKRFMIIE
tara:strand:- start:835 stop:1080 length:246 start_codon:yes stop_codon:yes gene_type:complete